MTRSRHVFVVAALAAFTAGEGPICGDSPFSPFQSISMGAELVKPYTEIEYQGVVYPLVELTGGHNGRSPTQAEVVAACRTNPPVFDATSGLWRVPVSNNLIHFGADVSPLGRVRMGAVEDQVTGYLEFPPGSGPLEDLGFPVRSVFTFRVRVELLDAGVTLFSEQPVMATADNLPSWPPPIGTVYAQPQAVPLVAVAGGPAVATLRPDTTVITGLVQPVPAIPTLSALGWVAMATLLAGAMLLVLALRRASERRQMER